MNLNGENTLTAYFSSLQAMQEATVAHDVDVDDDIDYAGIMSTLNGIGNGDGEIDENFWAQAAAQGAREGGGPMDGEGFSIYKISLDNCLT